MASSQLAAQLRILAGGGSATTSRKSDGAALASNATLSAIKHAAPGSTASKYKASFLFTADVAAATDSATIQSMGGSGMEQLAKLEPRLRSFQSALCGSGNFDRDAHNTQQIALIHAQINACIRLLAPYFMLKPTHKVLEFLIRRYSVHIYNISALLSAFLPYHESALFARLLQVLHIHLSVGAVLPASEPNTNKLFGFLETAQKEGVSSITRHTLVQRCMHDHAFLQWLIGLVALKGPAASQLSNTTITFYTTLMLELLSTLRGSNNANHSETKDAIARAIVQHALEVLNAQVNATTASAPAVAGSDAAAKPAAAAALVAGPPRELVFSALLLLSQAALVHPFGASLEAAFFLLLKSLPSARGDQTLSHPVSMALLALAQNQHVVSAPPKAIQALIASQGAEASGTSSPFVTTLANLSTQYDIAHLVQVILPQIAAAHVQQDQRKNTQVLLAEMVTALPLTDNQIHTLVSTLLNSYVAQHRESAAPAMEWAAKEIAPLRKLVLLLQEKYSTQLESVVQQIIEQANNDAAPTATVDEDGEMVDASAAAASSSSSKKKQKKSLKNSPVLSLVHQLFEGSAQDVLQVSLAGGAPQASSILTCLNSPLAHVRIQALQAVELLDAKVLASTSGDVTGSSALAEALIAKLSDADSSVVRATLKLKSLVRLVGFEELLGALGTILARTSGVVDHPSLTRSSGHKVLEALLKTLAKLAQSIWKSDDDEETSVEQQASKLASLLRTVFPFLFELALVRPTVGVSAKVARAAQALMVLLSSKAKHAISAHEALAAAKAASSSADNDDDEEDEEDKPSNGFLLCALFAGIPTVPAEVGESDLVEAEAIRVHNTTCLNAWANNFAKIALASGSPLETVQAATIEKELLAALERVASAVGTASRTSGKIVSLRCDAPSTGFALVQIFNHVLATLSSAKKTDADLFLRLARAQQKTLASLWVNLTLEQRRVASRGALVSPASFVNSTGGASMSPVTFPAFVRASLAALVSTTCDLVAKDSSAETGDKSTAFLRELYGFFVADAEAIGAFGTHIALLCKQHLQGGGLQETVKFLLPVLQGSGAGNGASLQVSVRSFHLLHALLHNQAASASSKSSKSSKSTTPDSTVLAELGATFLLAFASPARAVRHAALMAVPALTAALGASEKKASSTGALVAQLLTAVYAEKEELMAASSVDASRGSGEDESLVESTTDASLQYVQAFMLKMVGGADDASNSVFKTEAARIELQKFFITIALRYASVPSSMTSGWRLLQVLRRLPADRVADLTLVHLSGLLSSGSPIRSGPPTLVAVELLDQVDAEVLRADPEQAFTCLMQALGFSVGGSVAAAAMSDDHEEVAASSKRAVYAIQQAALARISTPVFELLSAEQQEQLFAMLLRINTNGQSAAAALVAQLPFDSAVFAKRLVLGGGASASSSSKKSSKKAAEAVPAAGDLAAVQSVLELLQLKDPQRSLRTPFALVAPLFTLLEQLSVQSKDVSAAAAAAGTQSAAEVTSKLQTFEYAKQLTMAALNRFLAIPVPAESEAAPASDRRKSKKAPAASAGFNVKDINVDAVVACLSASGVESPQPAAAAAATLSPAGAAHSSLHTLNVSLENTRSHALTLLSLIGKSHPELIVDRLIPIFQTLLVHSTHSASSENGETRNAANAVSSAMEVDGEIPAADGAAAAAEPAEPYALRLLNQLISTVLPSIVQAKLQWNVWQLLGVFVDSLTVRSSVAASTKALVAGGASKKKAANLIDGVSASLVNRRRLHLFHNLLTSLQVPGSGEAGGEDDSNNYLHVVVALLLAKSVTEKSNVAGGKQAAVSSKASLIEFAHKLCEEFGQEPVFQIRAFNSLLQLLSAEIDLEHGELLASQQKHVGAALRLGAKSSSRSKKSAAASEAANVASPLTALLRTPIQISSWQKGVLSFLSQHLARLSFAQQIYLHAKRTQQEAGAEAVPAEGEQDEIQTSFLHLFEHLFARLRSSLQLSKHLSSDSSSASLANHFLLLSTHTKQALLHLNGLLTMPNFVRILQELFRISGEKAGRDVPLILQALSLLNSKLISYKDRAKIHSFAGGKKKVEDEGEEDDVDMSDPNSVERVVYYRNKKAEQRLLVSLLPALQQLLEVEPASAAADASEATSASNADLAAMKQSALLNLEMLTSSFGHMRQFQAEFVKLVPAILRLTTLPKASASADEKEIASVSEAVQTLLHSHSWQHISTSALLCLATLVSSFHAKAHVLLLEFIPTMVPNTLAILQQVNAPPAVVAAPTTKKAATKSKKRSRDEESEEEDAEEEKEDAALQTLDTLAAPLLQLSALSLLQACIMSVSDLLSPYLADLLKVLLFPGYHNHAAASGAASSMALLVAASSIPANATVATAAASATSAAAAASPSSVDHSSVSTVVSQSLNSLIALVPSRTLLPYIFNHYKIAAAQGYSSLRRLFQVLALVIQQLKSDAVKQHFKLIFKFFLAAAQQLRKSPSVSGSAQDRYGVTLSQAEDALIGAFLELTMKLNETSFKGLFLKMLQWVGPIPNSVEAAAAASADVTGAAGSTQEFLNRSLVFFKLIHQLTGKLKGIFTTYFGYILDHCVVFLNAPKTAKASSAAAAAALKAAQDDSEEDGEEDEEGRASKKQKQIDGSASASASAKAASTKALLSGGIAGGVPSELIDLVMNSLRNCFLYDTQHFLDKYHFQLLTAPMVQQLQYAFNTRVNKQAQAGKHAHEAFDEFVTNTITPTLVQMAIRMGNYLQWKPLVSALMLHGRSQSAAVRRAAVYVFEQLFVSIGDNLLVILPELLPWISELLEDGDVGVERNVQKLVKIIEKLSGESLDATLQG